jgi:PIN domain nuclease of toxin-antitoxin system
MKLRLDMHIFLWLISNDRNLSNDFRNAIIDPQNKVYLSVVSIWEALIKFQKGKLPLRSPAYNFLIKERRQHFISPLPIHEFCLRHLASLPHHHGDPFDRMLICQAIEYDLTFVTNDLLLRNYPINFLT